MIANLISVLKQLNKKLKECWYRIREKFFSNISKSKYYLSFQFTIFKIKKPLVDILSKGNIERNLEKTSTGEKIKISFFRRYSGKSLFSLEVYIDFELLSSELELSQELCEELLLKVFEVLEKKEYKKYDKHQ